MLRDWYNTIRIRWAVQAATEDVLAVDDVGLVHLLDDAGLKAKFDRGDVLCKFCRTSVTQETVYAVIRDSGSVKVVCSQPQCVSQLLEWIESK